MPKKAYKKKTIKARKGFKKGKKTSNVMVNKTPAKAHTVIAPIYMTKISSLAQGTLTLSSGASPTGYPNITFAVGHNTVANPWLVGALSAMPPSSGFIDSPLVGGTIYTATYTPNSNVVTAQSNVQPMGFVVPLLNMYRQFRVLGSKIRVTIVPVASGSEAGQETGGLSGTLIVYPQRMNGSVAGAPGTGFIASTDPIESMNIPYAKWKAFQFGDDIKNNTIESYIGSAQLLGMTKKEYKIRSDVIQQFYNTTNDVSTGLKVSPTVETGISNERTNQGTLWTIMINPSVAPTFMTSQIKYIVDIQVDYYLQCENPINNLGIGDEVL